MRNKLNIGLILLFIFFYFLIYYKWFFLNEIIGGDWPYLYKEALAEHPFFVPSWSTWHGNGLGGTSPFYFLQSYEYFTIFLSNFFHIPWTIIYKIFWFGVFLFSSFFASFRLLRNLFPRTSSVYAVLAGFIYSTNTYILMVVGGGQMGVALAYSLAPFVLSKFILLMNLDESVVDKNSTQHLKLLKNSVLTGTILALQVIFDPRISYVTLIAVFFFFSLNLVLKPFNFRNFSLDTLYIFVFPSVATILLNLFWILPIFLSQQNFNTDFGESFSGVGIVKLLSFAHFSDTLSLLHPNWPENIFGKVYFMRIEFLLLPVFAYFNFLFLRIKNKVSKDKKIILFFALLGLIGAFLAKGENPPYGETYIWLFQHFPGFILFRDPTKFYILTVLSYSIIIPYGLYVFSKYLVSKNFVPSGVKHILLVIFLVIWIFTIRQAILGRLSGTFLKREVPEEYFALKNFLQKQPDFFRTLWIPRQQRFTFFSAAHPSVEASPLFNASSSAQIIQHLQKEEVSKYLSELSVKYIIVPYDVYGDIFISDRKYSQKKYEETVNGLKKVLWLKEIDGFGKIVVFEALKPKDHLSLDGNGTLSYSMVSSTHYKLTVSVPKIQNLVFSEKYNPYWEIKVNGHETFSNKTKNGLNSFELKKGIYTAELLFSQDVLYLYGRIISLTTCFAVITFMGVSKGRSVLSHK